MTDAVQSFRVALAGNPNCGKTALFNAITGGRQKVGNYPGVTVERKEGRVVTTDGVELNVLDLPGTYSLDARTPDEMIARNVILGRLPGECPPRLLIAVADATNLERNLGLVLELRSLNIPVVLALNMMDLAKSRGLSLDLAKLSEELRVPVVPTVAIRNEGISEILLEVQKQLNLMSESKLEVVEQLDWRKSSQKEIHKRFAEVDRILTLATRTRARPLKWTDKIDRIVVHPLLGSLLLILTLGVMFQMIFNWAVVPQDLIRSGVALLGDSVGRILPDGAFRSLLIDGVIAGVGSVLVFLPQILLLFAFILFLEDSGYMARAAFLMDRLMGKVGLHGRAFIPLLSSYACAIPGIMATRTIENRRDRLTTILIAPLTTCSARLPVYALLIAAFIPNSPVWGPVYLQGLVMFALYAFGIASALIVAVVLRKTVLRGPKPPLILELPSYKWPRARSIGIGLLERTKIFLRRAGTVILTLSIVLWFLASYPKPPVGATAGLNGSAEPAINYSFAGQIGKTIAPVLKPIGFDWRIAVALIPGFAAREVMVSALATVYAVEAKGAEATAEAKTNALGAILSKDWTVATALSLLVWYVLALQCLSTLAVTRRETNSWRWPFFMLAYMTTLAYLGSFVTYRLALMAGLG